jgi:hypothetical protein
MARIVKFNNGKYGIQVGFIFAKYVDLKSNWTWSKGGKYFQDCQGSLEEVKEIFSERYPEVVKFI